MSSRKQNPVKAILKNIRTAINDENYKLAKEFAIDALELDPKNYAA